MPSYNKLVRDNIPSIIRTNGEEPRTHILENDEEYIAALVQKFSEEIEEFLAEPSAEEAGDILEVLHALCSMTGVDAGSIEDARKEKFEKRGGFAGRIVLDGVE